MSYYEELSVGNLIVKKIKAGVSGKASKVLRMYACTPAAKVANRYFTTAAMHLGAYTLANSGLPGDSLAHNVTCVVTDVDVTDTRGTLLVTGLDLDGKVITETITPGATGVTVQGTKAFAKVTSIVGSGWVVGGSGADTIVIGFGDLQGLPEKIALAADILLEIFDTAAVNAPTVTVSSTVLSLNTITAVGDGTKQLKVIYQV